MLHISNTREKSVLRVDKENHCGKKCQCMRVLDTMLLLN